VHRAARSTTATGTLLADNAPSFNIVFRPLPAESTRVRARRSSRAGSRACRRWSSRTEHVRDLVRFANRSGQTSVLRSNASHAVLAAVEEERGELTGLEVMVEPMRRYPHGDWPRTCSATPARSTTSSSTSKRETDIGPET
jgi:cell division protein FtsI/penicillin-binding protein 2